MLISRTRSSVTVVGTASRVISRARALLGPHPERRGAPLVETESRPPRSEPVHAHQQAHAEVRVQQIVIYATVCTTLLTHAR